mmetsp:Transcript_20214/g.56198  ORF Transcript_20214/g.56198 Transcript_20214/m.56198 type:complete len:318 (+) Transcript_20214:145-1098(+)
MSYTTAPLLINGVSDVLTSFFAPDLHLPPKTVLRNIPFMTAHFGFFIVNVMNAFVLIFFEGFVTGRLRFNRASQLSLAAHLFQLHSCFTSIRRHNHNDEYGCDAMIGTITGIVGFFFMNLSYLHLHCRRDADGIRKGTVFWTIACGVCGVKTFPNWDTVHFDSFRILIGFSAFTHICILLKSRRDLLRGMFYNELPSAALARIWISSIVLLVISFVCAATKIPVFTYPGTGIIYSVCMVNSMLTGRMSFAKDTHGTSVDPKEEQKSIRSDDNQNYYAWGGCDEECGNSVSSDVLIHRSNSNGSTASTESSSSISVIE